MKRRRPGQIPVYKLETFPLFEEESDKVFSINLSLEGRQKEATIALIWGHISNFTRKPSDIPWIKPEVMTHKLNVFSDAYPTGKHCCLGSRFHQRLLLQSFQFLIYISIFLSRLLFSAVTSFQLFTSWSLCGFKRVALYSVIFNELPCYSVPYVDCWFVSSTCFLIFFFYPPVALLGDLVVQCGLELVEVELFCCEWSDQ